MYFIEHLIQLLVGIFLFFLPIIVLIWIIVLHSRINKLTERVDELKEKVNSNLSSHDRLFESLEFEINRRCSIIQQQQEQYLKQQQQKQYESDKEFNDQYTKASAEPVSESIKKTNEERIKEKVDIFKQNYFENEASVKSESAKVETEEDNRSSSEVRTESVSAKVEKQEETISENKAGTEGTYSKVENQKETVSENKARTEGTYSEEEKSKVKESIYNNKKESEDDRSVKQSFSLVQLFSWIGGFILLLGVIFSIKYALENNIISASMRIAIGTLVGIGLWIGGALMRKPDVKTTSDTLCACGLCTCYSIWFAGYYFYQLIPPTVAFIMLSLVALASFGTAVWKNAQYIGFLAQIIGFLTPALFHSETPNVWFLLAYTGLINVAAISAALKRDWNNQLYSGLAFTFLSFLTTINNGSAYQIILFAGLFSILYTIIATLRNQNGLLRFAFIFAFIALFVIGFPRDRILSDYLFCFIAFSAFFSIGFGLLASYKKKTELSYATLFFAFVSFLLFSFSDYFLLLFIYIVIMNIFFGFLNTKTQDDVLQIGTLILTILSFIVLFINYNFWNHIDIQYLPYFAGFSVFFTLFFGIIAYKKKNINLFGNTIVFALLSILFMQTFKNDLYITSLSAVFTLFFGILSHKLESKIVKNYSIAFTFISLILISIMAFFCQIHINYLLTFAILSVIFYSYFAVKENNGELLAATSVSLIVPLTVISIYTISKGPVNYNLIEWILGWNLLIMLIPYLFKKNFENSKIVWSILAFCNFYAGLLILIQSYYINNNQETYLGRIAYALTILYAIYTERVVRFSKLEEGIQNYRVTALAIAPILFLTIAIRYQFANEYMTIGFAVEGLSLIVLWHLLPVDLFQNSGFVVLMITAMRLLFNPNISHYYVKTALIWNWFLYTYLLAALCMFGGSYCWREKAYKDVKAILNAAGGFLIFVLVNIEIANYFAGGYGIPFHFCGELSEAATYTIAWTICGAICMLCFNKKSTVLQKTGVGLICLSLLKLFLSDIWQLSSGLRIAVLISVAVIMLVISFTYQYLKKKV